MLLHHPKINGAVMAQIDLLHHWKNPTHGDGAKPRAITPVCSGACNGADTPISRYAPAALCLRRRSQPHRSHGRQYGLAGSWGRLWIALNRFHPTRNSGTPSCGVVSRWPAGFAARVIQRVLMLARCYAPPSSRTNPQPSCGLCGGELEAVETVSASGHRHHWPFGNIWPSSHKSPHENHRPKGVFACGLPHSKSFLGSNGALQVAKPLAIPGMLARSGRDSPPNFGIDPRGPDFLGRPILYHAIPYPAAASPITRDAMQCILAGGHD
jgi:hypothetical protein